MQAGATLGRFRLLRRLGEGAQAEVWLAHDPRLDREVALKLLSLDASGGEIEHWLHEARAVSRLSHPALVQVFEADRIVNGSTSRAALVFEYVPGGTLAALLRQGAQPVRRSVELILAVLDALATAHAAGIVHRDLKPGNILLDLQGRPRVTDFGIAARAADAAEARIVGTPGYISPEAARGAPPHPQMDVFAAGILLAELISGQRLNADSDPMRALERVLSQDLQLPAIDNPDVDDGLRAHMTRALARDPAQRWPSAAALRDALQAWLQPPEPESPEDGNPAALEFLLRRMRAKADFPGLSASIEQVQRLTQNEDESIGSLAGAILKDVALTNKLLRLVNTVQFRHAGGGSINTVSRAVALIGFGGVRNLALSLVLLERMQDRGHAAQLRTEFLRGLMAGSLARELCDNTAEGEELFLAALFQNLGRLLCEFYFAEEASQVRRAVQGGASEISAATRALGTTYEELGIGVAKRWGLPDALTRVMRRPSGEPPPRAVENPLERHRWLARTANDTADLLLNTEPAQAAAALRRLAERHARALKLPRERFEAACQQARERLASLAGAMELTFDAKSPAQRLLPTQTPPATPEDADLDTVALPPSEPTVLDERGASARRAQASEQLAAGIQDITDAMVEQQDLGAILRMILETMVRALALRRVAFCLRDAKTGQLVGRFGLGDQLSEWLPLLRIPLNSGAQPDLFSAVCLKGVDTLIADTTQPNIAQRLPAWYQSGALRAGSFLLLPVVVKGAPLGLIYADRAEPNGIVLDEKELKLLRTLRNQAVMAFRQG